MSAESERQKNVPKKSSHARQYGSPKMSNVILSFMPQKIRRIKLMKKSFVKYIITGLILSATVLSVSVYARIEYTLCSECGQMTMWSVCGGDELQDSPTGTCPYDSNCRVYYYTCSTKRFCKNCGNISNPFERHDERIEHSICDISRNMCHYH